MLKANTIYLKRLSSNLNTEFMEAIKDGDTDRLDTITGCLNDIDSISKHIINPLNEALSDE